MLGHFEITCEKEYNLAKQDCGLDQSPTVMVRETKVTTKLRRNILKNKFANNFV
jgi:hypothetical protein